MSRRGSASADPDRTDRVRPGTRRLHPPRPTVTEALLGAFARRRTALIRYEDRHGAVTEREIELQFLYCNLPVWYALAWDLPRGDVRTFHIDRIQDVQVLPGEFRARPPGPFLAAGEETARTM